MAASHARYMLSVAVLALCVLPFVCGVPDDAKIKTVVVLMEENRSFDHMLGFLTRTNPAVHGLTGHETNPINTSDPAAGHITVSDTAPYVSPYDPCHGLDCVTEQIYGASTAAGPARMDGFAQLETALGNDPQNIMNMFTPDRLPVLSTLAQEFALFDEWYASVPGPTNPNRRFLHCATACGSLDDADYDPVGFTCRSVFDNLDALGIDWAIHYYDWSPSCMLQSLRTPAAQARTTGFDTFYARAKNGTLPPYTFLEPRMFPTASAPANDQHPDHNVLEGEQLYKDVYEALRASPQWNETLFVLTYDEHGGFYDHAIPQNPVPNPDGLDAPQFNFSRIGVRVPTVVISPWIEKGTLVHTPQHGPTATSQFEHSSVPATLKKVFGWDDFLTKRDAWAAPFDFLWTTNRTEPRTDCPKTLPSIPPSYDPVAQAARELAKPVNDLQAELIQQVNTCSGAAALAADTGVSAPEVPRFSTQAEASEWIRARMEEILHGNGA